MLLDLYFHSARQIIGGGIAIPKDKKANRPAWVIPQQFAKPRHRRVEEAEALILCGLL